MKMESSNCEIVFLIDTSLAYCSERDHCSEVLLTVLRLLSNIYHGCPKTCTEDRFRNGSADQPKNPHRVNMKWGFKFFNTSRTPARNRTCNTSLKSFKLAHLEDFERKMKELFSMEKEDTVKQRSKSLQYPAELLSTALTEALHDFKWTMHDIPASPVTRRRSSNKCDINFMRKIFVLTKAPRSRRSLRHFSNKMVIDSDVFIDSFMSPALLHEYQQKMKISVNCVDFLSEDCTVNSSFNEDEKRAESVSILKDAFAKLGGSYVSRDVIVCSIPVTDDVTLASENSLSDFQQTFSCFPSESLLLSLQGSDFAFIDVQISATLSCRSFQNLPVNLVPVAVNNKTGFSSFADTIEQSKGECTSWSSYLKQSVDIHFTLLGCITRAALCDLIITSFSQSFLINCNSDSLSSLLQHLAASRTIGVLSLKIKGKTSLTLALLQTQNGEFGFISLLNFSATVSIEKAYLQYVDADRGVGAKLESDIKQKNKDQLQRSNLMERLNDDIQTLKSSLEKGQCQLKEVQKRSVFNSHCMNSWHVPGSTGQMSSVISKINERLDTLDRKSEKDFLKQLQKYYTTEKHPAEVIQNTQPRASTPVCGFRNLSVGSSGESESSCRSLHKNLRRGRSSTLSRGRLMVDKARSATFATAEDENESLSSRPGSLEKRQSSSVGLIDLDLKTEEDLASYLHRQYDQVLKAGIAIEASIQAMVTVTSQFMSSKQLDNPQKTAVSFIHKCLALSSSELKEKHSNEGLEEIKKNKITEYKLQVMLLLEMESLLKDADTRDVLNELVSMLRALSFSAGATSLKDFLTDIVASYSVTQPKLLVDIFDELMLPLPEALAEFASPAGPSSAWGAGLSTAADGNSVLSTPGSSQPASHLSDQSSQQAKRFHRFKQHPSFSDFRQRKQILVKPVNKPKGESKKTTKDKVKMRTRTPRARNGDCERAKRNLFAAKSKPSHSVNKEKIRASRRRKHGSSSAAETSRTLVLGTPVHKQTSHRHLQQQERRRRRENIQPEIQVVAESPVKDGEDADNCDGDSSNATINRPARYIVREAFYSCNTQPSRNLARSLELAQKVDEQQSLSQQYLAPTTKSQGTLASAVRGESPILSPRSRFLKALMSSPSPAPKSKLKNKNSVTTPVRRSSRKSVKKLVFKESSRRNTTNKSRPADTEHAHLIFDGENANDFDLLTNPGVGCSRSSFQEGFKTPEKQVIHSLPDVWENSSCPPASSSGLNLSFKNILSSQDVKTEKLSKPSSCACDTGSAENLQPQVKITPLKLKSYLATHLTPDLASRLQASVSSKSPSKASPWKANGSFLSFTRSESTASLSSKHVKTDAQSDIDPLTTPKKRGRVDEPAECEYTFSTPKRRCLSHVSSTDNSHSTPSKVKFSDSCPISSPAGSREPPSLERSTPGKSILKHSPLVKQKVKYHMQLQPVPAPPVKLTQQSPGMMTEISQGFQIHNSPHIDHNQIRYENDMSVSSTSYTAYHTLKDQDMQSVLPIPFAQKEPVKLHFTSSSSATAVDVSFTNSISSRNSSVVTRSSGFSGQVPRSFIGQKSGECNGSASSTQPVTTSPERKQYSPALSAKGLLQLIKSPFISSQSGISNCRDRDTHKRYKSRKHLEWN